MSLGFLAMAKGNDEGGTMNVELPGGGVGSRSGGRKGGGAGKTKAGMCQKTNEMPVYDRAVKVCSTTTNELEASS